MASSSSNIGSPPLPIGYSFLPTDEELISFLFQRAKGLPFVWNKNLHDIDLYKPNGDAYDPRARFCDVPNSCWVTTDEGWVKKGEPSRWVRNVKKLLYVFTRLPLTFRNSFSDGDDDDDDDKVVKRRFRTCSGTWREKIDKGGRVLRSGSENEVIGRLRVFAFDKYLWYEREEDDDDDGEEWVMDELSLDGVSLNEELVHNGIVLCRISWSYKEYRDMLEIIR